MKIINNENLEKVQPGIFHIHVDSKCNFKDKQKLFKSIKNELDFIETNFSGHPLGYSSITTPYPHLTLKLDFKSEFNIYWEKLVKLCKKFDFAGYIEGEYIPIDEIIPLKEYNPNISIPFTFSKRSLNGLIGEEFRKCEIHLTLDSKKSHPQIIKNLLKSGFSGAYMPKKNSEVEYKALVLTAQGFPREINKLFIILKKYLWEVGGINKGTLKIEIVLKYQFFHMDYMNLPKIVEEINYLN